MYCEIPAASQKNWNQQHPPNVFGHCVISLPRLLDAQREVDGRAAFGASFSNAMLAVFIFCITASQGANHLVQPTVSRVLLGSLGCVSLSYLLGGHQGSYRLSSFLMAGLVLAQTLRHNWGMYFLGWYLRKLRKMYIHKYRCVPRLRQVARVCCSAHRWASTRA